MADRSPNRWKTLLEKEKLLVTSNFSFSQCFQKTHTADTLKPGLVWERVKLKPGSVEIQIFGSHLFSAMNFSLVK